MNILKAILNFLKSAPGIISTGFFLVGAVAWYNAQVIKGYNKKLARTKMEINVDKILASQKADSIYKIRQEHRIDSLIGIFGLVRGQINNIQTVQGNLQTYMSNKVATKEGLQEVIDVFNAEKKKSGMSSLLIPLRPSEQRTQ